MTSIEQPHATIFIFSALACEAKPLIKFYGLKQDQGVHAFSIFKADQIILTVTGAGKVAMAGAVAYSLALFNRQPYPVILNIGIAGHKTQSTGHLYRVIKIFDEDTSKAYYPPLITKTVSETSVLTTVSKPVSQYKADQLYDMEGAAFYEIAVRFSSSELVQCIKIVSDNEQSSIEKINSKQVYQWVFQKIEVIDPVIQDLLALSAGLISIEPDGYQQFIVNWHFTVTGQIRLKALLMRWQLLSNGVQFTVNKNEIKNAKEILTKLETELNRLAFFL